VSIFDFQSGGQCSPFWRTNDSFGVHLEDKPFFNSCLRGPDEFGDFGARFGTFYISCFQFFISISQFSKFFLLSYHFFCLSPSLKKGTSGQPIFNSNWRTCWRTIVKMKDLEDKYLYPSLKKGTSGQPIFNLKLENILEDNCQNGGFGGQSGPMENILLKGEHLTPMVRNSGRS
jgi:hypothetical protein